MGTETYSVKASEETQERIKFLISESGMNGKDFFINLLSVYELQKAKEIAPTLAADIEELETLTRRINTIFMNTSERVRTMQTEAAEERERQALTDRGTMTLLQQRINDLEKERSKDEESINGYIKDIETAREQIADLQNQIKLSVQANEGSQALLKEYRSKNDTLTAKVNDYNATTEKNNELRLENNKLIKKIDELETQATAVTVQHNKDMEQIRTTLKIEHDKAILEINTRHLKELQGQQEDGIQALRELLEKASTTPATPVAPPSRSKKSTAKKKTATEAEG